MVLLLFYVLFMGLATIAPFIFVLLLFSFLAEYFTHKGLNPKDKEWFMDMTAFNEYNKQLLEQVERLEKYRTKPSAAAGTRIRVASTALDRAGKALRQSMLNQ